MAKVVNPPHPFGTRLVEARKAVGISRYALAQKSGRSETALLKLERGERLPHLDMLIDLARVLDIDPVKLFAGLLEDMEEYEKKSIE